MRRLCILTVALLAPAPAWAEVVVEDAYIRAAPPNARAGGAFVTMMNNGEADRVLVSAASPVAERVELHTHTMEDGVMRMREVEGGVPAPAGEVVAMGPGGLHIMLIGLTTPLTAGESAELTLTFDDGQTVTLDAPIRAYDAMKGHHGGGGGHGDGSHGH